MSTSSGAVGFVAEVGNNVQAVCGEDVDAGAVSAQGPGSGFLTIPAVDAEVFRPPAAFVGEVDASGHAFAAEVDAEVRRLRALPRVRLGRDRTLRIEVHETPSDLGPNTLRRRGLQGVGAGLAALAVAAWRAFT